MFLKKGSPVQSDFIWMFSYVQYIATRGLLERWCSFLHFYVSWIESLLILTEGPGLLAEQLHPTQIFYDLERFLFTPEIFINF